MGSGDCTNEVETCQNIPTKSDSNIGPITPDSERENVDFTVDFDSPPSSDKAFESPQTPQESVFDPFAPGPDEKALAPLCRKYAAKPRSIVARRLSFDSPVNPSGGDGVFVSDEEIVEAVYENLLETIVSKQTEAVLASRDRDQDQDPSECMTPDSSPPRLSGVAVTCPGAPLRPGPTSRKVDPSLCRRLQFSP